MALCAALIQVSTASTLVVGAGQTYTNPQQACAAARPGDTILILPGDYTGTFFIRDVHGTSNAWITIVGADRDAVRFLGGSESMHFSDCSYIRMENFTVTGQTSNGMNIDDAGTIETPAHHIEISNVAFQDMAATGNNDLLKLSGLDDFVVQLCIFSNGSAGGSGIDMVGCHRGIIRGNIFTSMGSNAIQAKGGTQYIDIYRNRFTNCGQRTLNLGGSTGLQFFRPIDAPFEAADIRVFLNVIEGSLAPVAFVGCVRVEVVNNLIQNPERWVFRILQETVEPVERFQPCGENTFRNNIVLYTNVVSTVVNIGANTAPSTFTVSHNLWYNPSAGTSVPTQGLPFTESNSLAGLDPRLNAECPTGSSPAIAAGIRIPYIERDFHGKPFGIPPSIGACEIGMPTDIVDVTKEYATSFCWRVCGWNEKGAVLWISDECSGVKLAAYSISGKYLRSYELNAGTHVLDDLCGYVLFAEQPR